MMLLLVKERDLLDAGSSGWRRAADVDEDALGLELAPVHADPARAQEPRVAADELDMLHAADPLFQPFDRLAHDASLAASPPPCRHAPRCARNRSRRRGRAMCAARALAMSVLVGMQPC